MTPFGYGISGAMLRFGYHVHRSYAPHGRGDFIATKAVKNNKKVKSVVVGANVKKIANKAFFKCPNLKKITIKSVKFTKKNLNKKAFKGLHKKLVVKVPKKVYGLKEGILKEGLVK